MSSSVASGSLAATEADGAKAGAISKKKKRPSQSSKSEKSHSGSEQQKKRTPSR